MDLENLKKEFFFKSTRSSGKGGQNVNKVSTKVELYFDILNSKFLSEEEKILIIEKLYNKTDKNGVLRLTSESERSQKMNKEKVIEKFYRLISKSLKKKKNRVKTLPTKESKEIRLKNKKIISEKKSLRRNFKDFE